MSNPTFKDIEAAARWVTNNLPAGDEYATTAAALAEDLAFFVAAARYMERQRCADEVEKYDDELAGVGTSTLEGIPHNSLEIAASRIRALGAGDPRP